MVREVALKETKHVAKGQTALYATGADFCRIFAEDAQNLYFLSLLLTASHEKAEQCFVSGLDDCAAGNQVFKEWARRAIIKDGIRVITPEPVYANGVSSAAVSNGAKGSARPQLQMEISPLFDLQNFERFVSVMSVLEGSSDRDCALLVGCTRESLIEARVRALRQTARSVIAHGGNQAAAGLKTETVHDTRDPVTALAIPARLATPV